jgi:hypothetical protein
MDAAFTAGLDFGEARSAGATIAFQPVESENPLPEVKKDWLKKAWARIVQVGYDGLFETPVVLSPSDTYKTTPTPLETQPIPAVTGDNGPQIEEVMRKRAVITAENKRKQDYRDRVIKDAQVALGAALLLALETNAPTTAEQMRTNADLVLVAESGMTPAKLNGVKMWKAYFDRKGLNDATRQDAEAEALFKELSVTMPENCTATQFGQLVAKFTLKVDKFMLRPLTAEMKVQWVLDRMPKTGACAAARVNIISKLRDTNRTGDFAYALQGACEACDDAHDRTLGTPDVGAVIVDNLRAIHGEKGYYISKEIVAFVNDIGTVFTATDAAAKPTGLGAGPPQSRVKSRTGGDDKKGKGKGGDPKSSGSAKLKILPNGARCKPDGTCNLNHLGWCARSALVNGTKPRYLTGDELKSYEKSRKEHAQTLGIQYTPLKLEGDFERLNHAKYPGMTCRQATDPTWKAPSQGRQSVVQIQIAVDEEEEQDAAWRAHLSAPNQSFENGSYMVYEVEDGEYCLNTGNLDGMPDITTVNPVTSSPSPSPSPSIESRVTPHFYAVSGGPSNGVHQMPRSDYDSKLRPYIDGVVDMLGPVRCKGAATRELAEAALTRLYAERSARRAKSSAPASPVPTATAGKLSFCVVTGRDAVASPLDPDRLLVGVHKCHDPAEIDMLFTAAGRMDAGHMVIMPDASEAEMRESAQATLARWLKAEREAKAQQPSIQVGLPINSEYAPCARDGCPCPASFDGVAGNFCCKTCAAGTPCAEPWHQRPSQWPAVEPAAEAPPEGRPRDLVAQLRELEPDLEVHIHRNDAAGKVHVTRVPPLAPSSGRGASGGEELLCGVEYEDVPAAAAPVEAEKPPDWLPPEQCATLAMLLYLFVRTLACRVGAQLGDLLSLVVGAVVICIVAVLIGVVVPVSAPASVALALHGGTSNAVGSLASSYGIVPYLPPVSFPTSKSAAAEQTVQGWLILLATLAVLGFFSQLVQRALFAMCRWLGVAALRMLVDLDNNLRTTRSIWASWGRHAGRLARHVATMVVMGGLMMTLTTFLVSVAPVGGTPTCAQLNAAAEIMDHAPLLAIGMGRRSLDAFTVSTYSVSIAVSDCSVRSGLETLEMCESLGLEATVDLDAAREGGWATGSKFETISSPRREYAHAYKNASLNIWDLGANRGNFTSLKYAKRGTVRDNEIKMSTAAGLYQPPKIFDAVVPVQGYRNGKKVTKMVEVPGSFLNEKCPHNLLPPGVLAIEQAIGTWIAPSNGASFATFPDGTTARLINMGIVVLPDSSTPCEPVHQVPSNESSSEQSAVAASDLDVLCPGVTVGDRGFTKQVDGARIHYRFNHRDPKRLIDLPRCTNAPSEWADIMRKHCKAPHACDPCLRGNAKGVGSAHHVPDAKVVGGIVSFDCYTLSTPHRYGGQRKIIRFRDLKSRGYGRSYLLKSESESAHAMGLYHAWCKTKGVTNLRYHTDNATVFVGAVGATCRTKAAALGAHFTTISPNVPRQNGLSEHDWSVLGGDVRAMCAAGKLPRSMAWYCWQQAEEVAACIPFKDDPDNCQYSLFHGGVKPHVAKYRPPGCLCYVKIIKNNPNKEQEQAVRAIHLCRARDQPGYCCLDPESGRIYVTPHVRFVEDEFPGITMSAGGSERVVPSFADDYDPNATRVDSDAPDNWYPIQPIPGAEHDVASPEQGAPAPRPLTAAERRAAAAPPPGERVADRRPKRGVATGASSTEHRGDGATLFTSDLEPQEPFIVVIGSGVRRAGDIASYSNASTKLVVLVDTKLGGPQHDITDAAVVDSLCALVSQPMCMTVYLSAPCTTWCAARRLRPGLPQLRIDMPGQRWPMGMPNLTPYWQSVITEHNLIVANGVRVMQACWDAGGAAAAESPVDRSPARALDPRHVLPDCEGHVSQFTHPAFQHFMAVTGAHVFWGDQCALEWRPFPSAPLPPQKTTQWLATETLRAGGELMAEALRCPDHHDHSGDNSLVGGTSSGRFRTAGSEQYSPPLCRMLFDWLFSHQKTAVPCGDDCDDSPIDPDDDEPQLIAPGPLRPLTPPTPVRHNTRSAARRRDAHATQDALPLERHHDICLYVDDGFASADVDCPEAECDMKVLHERFKLTVQEEVDLFVGLNVSDNPDGSVELSSEAYINSLVGKYLTEPLDSYPKTNTPASDELRRAYGRALDDHAANKPVDEKFQKSYASLVGAMIYAVPGVRIAEAQAVAMLARALTFPTQDLMNCALRVLVHLGRTASETIRFSVDSPSAAELYVYTDSDWDTLNGTTGTVHMLAGAAIAHNSKKQPCISMSSTESEIIAASQGALEAVYFRRLLNEMQVPQLNPTKIFVDNQGAITLSKHQKSCHRSRHVLRRYFKVRELQAMGEVEVVYCPTDSNWSDFLTKVVAPKKWAQCKAATTGHAPAEPPEVSVHKTAPLDAWAVALGIPSRIATYAQYVAECGEPASCSACESGLNTSASIRRGVADFSGFSSASTCYDCEGDESSAESFEGAHLASQSFLSTQATHDRDVLNPQLFGLYETGIDDNWMAFPVTSASDNPSYAEAMRGGDKPKWDDACQDEIDNLKHFGAFEEWPESSVPGWSWVTKVARLVTECIWVLRRKRDSKNEISKYKARCVFNDKRRVNRALIETFSPAVRHTTVKASVAASVIRKRRRFSFDVTGAYLQGEYTENEEVFARPPRGFRAIHDDGSPIVWKMRVPLYGQGDAGLVWFRTIRKQLMEKQGFNQSDADPSYFWKRS